MKILKWLGIAILFLFILFFLIPLFLPSKFHVERSVYIDKPVDIVFQSALNMDLRAKWDPWLEKEPDAEIDVMMKPQIIGSGYMWKGKTIGEGHIEIKKFLANERIESKIYFLKPHAMEANVIWTFFSEQENSTKITWAFEGVLSYPFEKWFGIFMDKSLGSEFEKGLNNFKSLVEKMRYHKGRTGKIRQTTFEGLKALSITGRCPVSKLSITMFDKYSELMSFLKKNNITLSGVPTAIFHERDETDILIECALPIKDKAKGTKDIKYIEIPSGKVIMASHFGHFKTIKTTYTAIEKYAKSNNLEIQGVPWEMYMTNPVQEKDQSKWETQVYYFIK
ncbi:MAG: SRPBCC family protein [Bacteroidales bacterium]|nr:SRPBCC family protein [Bacteroidales bacterium]